MDYNNRFNYNDILVKSDTSSGNDLTIDNLISTLKNGRNFVNLEADISTFYLGLRSGNTAVSFFIRERIGARVFLPKDLLTFAWNGNASVIGKEIDISELKADVRYYREMGIGYWKNFPKQKFSFGVRLKYLTGILNVSTDRKFDGSVTTLEDNYQLAFDFSNATINTSGLDIFENGTSAEQVSHITNNANKGFGIDLGLNYQLSRELSVALAINDFGYINWKVNPKNYTLTDTTFAYGGLDFKDFKDAESAIQDSLTGNFVDTVTNNTYRTSLNTRIYGSIVYQLSDKNTFTATIANHGVVGKLRMLYGLGYTRKVSKVLSMSANLIKLPQQGMNLGIGTVLDLGPVQVYMATDRLLGYGDVTELNGLDFKFGINFIFGRGSKGSANSSFKTTKDDRKDIEHKKRRYKNYYGDIVDGIYWIIPKQKPRPIYNKREFKDE